MALDAQPTQTGILTVLELLAREAPARAFEGLLGTAGHSDASRARHEELDRALRLAADVREQLGRRQQREAVLSALVDTAHDLTLPYDLDALLRVIARRARLLLNLDMAYISFHDEETGDSYVRTADGHATALTVGFRVPGGSGLGSAVRHSSAPFWSPDYLADERVSHHSVIDDVVRAEGLRAIVAVPLRHRGSALGVLYAADRTIRHFTPDEIALMASLGDLASVAIEKTRVLSRARADIADLERYTSQAKSDLVSERRANDAHTRMTDLLLAGGDLGQLLAVAAETLGGTAAALDPDGRVLSATGPLPPTLPGPEETAKAVLETHVACRPVQFAPDLWLAPVAAGTECLGCVLLHTADPLSDSGLRLLRLTAGTTGVLMLMHRNTAVAESQVREEFFEDLLTVPGRPPAQLRDRARRLGLDVERPYAVAVIRPEGGSQGRAVVWASSYALRAGGLSTVRGGCLTLLLPSDNPGATARQVSDELSPLLGHPVTVGAAGPTTGLADVEPAHAEALRCLGALTALGSTGTTAAANELGFLGLLLGDNHSVGGYIADTIGPVIDYDSHRFTNLVQTLEAYFESGSSPTHAAETLHVHPNTVSRRLERITALLGEDWQEPARALEVQLALRLHRTRDTLRPDGPAPVTGENAHADRLGAP
ncbi:transcriptional regulator [Streptomyces venezuelae]|uniref:Transcriptional regulator n=1 Tax=Streptomyces venezuelae TaxID=54571 RepID=A0A5P2D4R8_STRVZ|nr:helix-turn-helix domain-containing protein [Streptomyces venezuelae]QES48321.1 transcriptional regulator [Streptomyces venezuelae]